MANIYPRVVEELREDYCVSSSESEAGVSSCKREQGYQALIICLKLVTQLMPG